MDALLPSQADEAGMLALQVQVCRAGPPGSPGHVRCYGSTSKG